jgi:hypothetical protein
MYKSINLVCTGSLKKEKLIISQSRRTVVSAEPKWQWERGNSRSPEHFPFFSVEASFLWHQFYELKEPTTHPQNSSCYAIRSPQKLKNASDNAIPALSKSYHATVDETKKVYYVLHNYVRCSVAHNFNFNCRWRLQTAERKIATGYWPSTQIS